MSEYGKLESRRVPEVIVTEKVANATSCAVINGVSRYTQGEALLPSLPRTGTNLLSNLPRTSRVENREQEKLQIIRWL
ncbi:hypothetical protein LLE87_30610, partial [Paenibacillus polymyxa]|nr:hypothetical protein [Paenibacillus polymyxa]